jgi:cell wall-associated NlpC family hydrolase
MRHVANSFGRTLAEQRTVAFLFQGLRLGALSSVLRPKAGTPRVRGGLYYGVILLVPWVPLFLGSAFTGCASSAPRFKSPERAAERIVQEDDEFRFASKIREEETREDDRKVDVNRLKKDLTVAKAPSTSRSAMTPKGLNRDRVLLDVVSYLGAPYQFGGTDKHGIDCSALTANVYASAVGKRLPRSTAGQYELGAQVSKDDLQIGDLVFFNTTGRTPSHVGIFIEDDLFAHASVSYGVTISSLESTYFKNRYVGARRIVE